MQWFTRALGCFFLVISSTSWAFTEKSLNEFDQNLLNRLEERCVKPDYLYSYPDLFLTADQRLACTVLSIFNPEKFEVTALNFLSARASYEDIVIDPYGMFHVKKYIAGKSRDELIRNGIGFALVDLVLDPNRKTELTSEELDLAAGPNFYDLFINPKFQDLESSNINREDLTEYAELIVSSAGWMSNLLLKEVVHTYRRLLIHYLYLGKSAEKYNTVIDFAMTMSEAELINYLAIEYFFSNIEDDPLATIGTVLKIRSFAQEEWLGIARQRQDNFDDLIDKSSLDVSIIMRMEDLRRCIDFHYSDRCLSSWKWLEGLAKRDPELIDHYLQYFPTLAASEVLNLSFSESSLRIRNAFIADSFEALSPIERRISLGLTSEYFVAFRTYQESKSKYPEAPFLWVMPVQKNAIEYWSNSVIPIVKLNVKQESKFRPNRPLDENFEAEVARILAAHSTLCDVSLFWLDCAHLIRPIDLNELAIDAITLSADDFLDEAGNQKEIDFVDGERLRGCRLDPRFNNFFQEKLKHLSLDSFISGFCPFGDLIFFTGLEPEQLPAFFLKSIAFKSGTQFTENGLSYAYGLGLISASIRNSANDTRLLAAPMNFQNLIQSVHHGIYTKSFADSALTKFMEEEYELGPNYQASAIFYEAIGAYEKALNSIIQAIDSEILGEETIFSWDVINIRITLRRILHSLGFSRTQAVSIDGQIPWNLAKVWSREELTEIYAPLLGDDGLEVLVKNLSSIDYFFALNEPDVVSREQFKSIDADGKVLVIMNWLAYLASLDVEERRIVLANHVELVNAFTEEQDSFNFAAQTMGSNFGIGSMLLEPVLAQIRDQNFTRYSASALEAVDFDSVNSLLGKHSFELVRFFANQKGMNRSVVAATLSTFMLNEEMSQLVQLFANKNSTLLRRRQGDFEAAIVLLVDAIGEIEDRELRNLLSAQVTVMQTDFHAMLTSAKFRERLLNPSNTEPVNRRQSESIKKNIKKIADSRDLRGYFEALGKAGDLFERAPLDLNQTSKSLFFLKDQSKPVLAQDIYNVFYSEGTLVVTILSQGRHFVRQFAVDDSVVAQGRLEIREIGALSNATTKKLCQTFEPISQTLSSMLNQVPVDMLFLVPSENLLPVPHEFIVGDVCSAKEAPAMIYASSISAVTEFLQSEVKPVDSIVAIGNPVIQNSVTVADSRVLKLSSTQSFPALPGAEREALEISLKFKEAKLLLRQDASIRNGLQLTEEGSKANVKKALLLATHGISAKPDLGIFFPSLLSVEDGEMALVSSADIYGFELNDAIVSLSACETGSGITDEEGMYFSGLPTSFADAGASFIVASLWPIPDEDSRIISTAFFEGLSDGMSEQLAVAKAQSSLGNTQRLPFAFILP